MDLMNLATWLLAASAPYAAYLLYKLLRSFRQHPPLIIGTEPTGDPGLRAALAEARSQARAEHASWDNEFLRAQGAPIPSAGDPYNIVIDLNRMAEWYAAQHKDLPDCRCHACNSARKEFFSKGGRTSWN